MREIIRPELLWREVIPLAVAAGVVALVFLIALPMLDTADGRNDAERAVEWTREVIGTLIAAVAAFGMFWRALNGEPLELQFGYVLALTRRLTPDRRSLVARTGASRNRRCAHRARDHRAHSRRENRSGSCRRSTGRLSFADGQNLDRHVGLDVPAQDAARMGRVDPQVEAPGKGSVLLLR